MPSRTIYIKEEDLPVFSQAQKMGSESISAIIIEALRRYVVEGEQRQNEQHQHQRIAGIIDRIVQKASTSGASDIHLQATETGNQVRIRVDGILREIDPVPKDAYHEVIRYIKTMAELDVDECVRPQSARFLKEIDGKKYNLFVSVLPAALGEAVTIRLLWQNIQIPSIEQLEPGGEHCQELAALASKPSGLIFVAGPAGSGKTTTLYSMLKHPVQRSRKVITIENPVEAVIADCVQVQVNYAQGASFSQISRAALHGDPDVIMVGEIRDQETARVCIEASIIGRLVLSVLHTRSAAAALVRLINLDVEPFLIRDAVAAVIGQALVRRLCDNCKQQEDVLPDPSLFTAPIPQNGQFFRAVGCDLCGHTGYRGQLALYEILILGSKTQQALFENSSVENLEKIAVEDGMTTLLEDGLIKASKGYTSLAEIVRFQNLTKGNREK